ncbi:MAG: hypothetical protein ACI9JZ_001959 [Lentimonas sp.]|jgi:hypothetical protein
MAWIHFIVLGCAAVCFSGCRSSDVVESVQMGSAVVAVSPVIASYGAAYGADASAQSSSIAVGAPAQWYSQKVTKSDLWRMNLQHGCKFHEPWKYMGTKDGEHYLALYPFLGFREMYRIAEDTYSIEAPFELTARTSKWREITVFSHLGIDQTLIIEPFLLEQSEGLVPVGVNVIQLDGLGGGVEDLFMQDVQILELK